MKLDAKTLQQIIRSHIQKTINHYVFSHTRNESNLKDTLAGLDEMIDQAKDILQKGNHYHYMCHEIDGLIEELGLRLNKDEAKQLAFHLTNAGKRGMEQAKRILTGEISPVC